MYPFGYCIQNKMQQSRMMTKEAWKVAVRNGIKIDLKRMSAGRAIVAHYSSKERLSEGRDLGGSATSRAGPGNCESTVLKRKGSPKNFSYNCHHTGYAMGEHGKLFYIYVINRHPLAPPLIQRIMAGSITKACTYIVKLQWRIRSHVIDVFFNYYNSSKTVIHSPLTSLRLHQASLHDSPCSRFALLATLSTNASQIKVPSLVLHIHFLPSSEHLYCTKRR